MNFKIIFLLLLGILLKDPVLAQTKIAYTQLEQVLQMMSEQKNIPQQLSEYQNQLAKKLETKKAYFDSKYQQYADLSQRANTDQAKLSALMKELQDLEQQLQKEAVQADQKLAAKQQELMAPLLEQVQSAIKAIAQEKGYTYVLNATASGSSIILKAAPSDNISQDLLTRLGLNP